MARRRKGRRQRRLNKTVAIIGSMVFALVALVAVVVLSYLKQDPEKFLAQAETAVSVEDYETAELNYRRAIGAVKDRTRKVELFFKLADTYMHLDQWPKVRACWNQIVVEEPDNIRARLALLDALYIQAHSQTRAGWQIGQTWKDLESQTTELLAVLERGGQAEDTLSVWQTLATESIDQVNAQEPLATHLYLIRGRAAYEQAEIGSVPDPAVTLEQAQQDLERVIQRDTTRVSAYWYLSRVLMAKGELGHLQGLGQARAEAVAQSDALLIEAARLTPELAQAHVYLVESKVERIRTFQENDADRRRRLQELAQAYQILTTRFDQAPEVWSSVARFYWIQAFFDNPQERQITIEKAIVAGQRSITLAPTRVDLILALAELHLRLAFMTDSPAQLSDAVHVASQALNSPEAADTTGPRTFANKANRLSIYAFLAHAAIEQVLSGTSDTDGTSIDTTAALAQAEEAVRQIEQTLGSGEDPVVAKWRGMLALARGQTPLATRELYAVYEKNKASRGGNQADPVVSYALARICLESPELGKALEFLSTSLRGGMGYIRPHVILDYLELLGRLDMWSQVLSSANPYHVEAYENYFGRNERSQILGVQALIGSLRLPEAEQALASMSDFETSTVRLHLVLAQARLRQHQQTQSATADSSQLRSLQDEQLRWFKQLLILDPAAVDETMAGQVLEVLVQQNRSTEVHDLLTQLQSTLTNSAVVAYYRLLIQEANTAQLTPAHQLQLREQSLKTLSDPLQRSLELGLFYQQQQDPDRALEAWQPLLVSIQKPVSVELGDVTARRQRTRQSLGASLVLGVALERQDWSLAEQVVKRVRQADLDDCRGEFFAAQLATARGQHAEALTKVNHCLELRPLYSHGYLLRSQIHTALSQYDEALADITEAARLNPMGPMIAKVHVTTLLQRNQRLEERVTTTQQAEAQRALERALRLDPTDLHILGYYAQQMVGKEPAKAVAIYQAIAKKDPTLEKTRALGDLATQVARAETDTVRQNAYYGIAESAFKQAQQIDPLDQNLLQSFARYYRLRGQEAQAEALLQQTQTQGLLWQHYLRQGQWAQAQMILERAYGEHPHDEQTLQGLLTVAQQQGDREAIPRYAAELVQVSDTLVNRIEQVTSLLRLGLVQEAQTQLAAARRRFPQEAKVTMLEGWVAMRLGQLPEALAKVDESLETQRDSAVAWYLRGQIQLLQGATPQAVEDLRRSKALDDTPATRLTLAKALIQIGRRDEAIVELKQAVTEPGASTQVAWLLERLYRVKGQWHELSDFYAQMQRRSPQDLHWLNQAAVLALEQRDIAKAESLYRQVSTTRRQALQGQPALAWLQDGVLLTACHGTFRCLLASAGPASAVRRPEKLSQVLAEVKLYTGSPLESVVQLYRAEAQLRLGQRAQALETCRAVLVASTEVPDYGNLVTRVQEILGPDTVQQLRTDLQTSPDSALAGHLMAFHLALNEQDMDQALVSVDHSLSLVSPDADLYWRYRQLKAASLTEAYGRTSEERFRRSAVSEYESLLEKWPTNINVLNNLAYLLTDDTGRVAEALAYAKKAWATQPNHPVILDTYGYVLFKDGQYDRALQVLSVAQQQYEESQLQVPAMVFEHLGMVWEALGDKAKARQAFEQALAGEMRGMTTGLEARVQSAIGRLQP